MSTMLNFLAPVNDPESEEISARQSDTAQVADTGQDIADHTPSRTFTKSHPETERTSGPAIPIP